MVTQKDLKITQKEEMKTVLESPIFKYGKVVRTYDPNYQSSKFEHNINKVDLNGIKGITEEVKIDGVFLEYRNVKVEKNYAIQVNHSFPLFKLHFEIEGNNKYTPENPEETELVIEAGHFNMFYLPEVNGTLSFHCKSRNTFEINFTEAYIRKILGDDFQSYLTKLGTAIKNKQSFILSKKSLPIPQSLLDLITDIKQCAFPEAIKKAYIEAKIKELLVIVLASSEKEKVNDTDLADVDYEQIINVERYIQTNLNHNHTIADLATFAGTNTSKLKSNFKTVFGTTIFKYITHLKMEKATNLIKKGSPISEASASIGYKNPQHFTAAFKKKFGFLPKDILRG